MINIDALRKDLEDESYAAYFGGNIGAALIEAIDIEQMSASELVDYARQQGIDLSKYEE